MRLQQFQAHAQDMALFCLAFGCGVLGISKTSDQYLTSPCKPAIRVASSKAGNKFYARLALDIRL